MAKKKTSKAATAERVQEEGAVDFESALAEVEQIVAKLEGGDLNLTESLQQYEWGIKRLKRCHQLLESAEQKVSQLAGFDADGNPLEQPLDGRDNEVGSGETGSSPSRVDDSPGLF